MVTLLIGAGTNSYPAQQTNKIPPVYLDGSGSPVLEADSVEPLVHIDGVLPGHNLSDSGALLFLPRSHCF